MVRPGGRWAAASAGAVGMLIAAGPAAYAGPHESWTETFHNTFTFSCDLGTPETSDDIEFAFETKGEVTFTVKSRGPNGLPLYSVRTTRADKITNTTTGLAYTAEYRNQEKDQRLLSQDGDIASILVGTTFHYVVFAPDGKRSLSNDGREEIVVEVDTSTGQGTVVELTKLVGRIHFDQCLYATQLTAG